MTARDVARRPRRPPSRGAHVALRRRSPRPDVADGARPNPPCHRSAARAGPLRIPQPLRGGDVVNAFEQLRRTDDRRADPTRPPLRGPPAARTSRPCDLDRRTVPNIPLPERTTTMTDTTTTTTTATPTAAALVLVPYLAVAAAAAALDWYTAALDGTETVRYVGDDGRIGHAEMIIHGARIMLSDAYPEIGVVAARRSRVRRSRSTSRSPTSTPSTTRSSSRRRTAERRPADQPHGIASISIVDPFGHRWMLRRPSPRPRWRSCSRTWRGTRSRWPIPGPQPPR